MYNEKHRLSRNLCWVLAGWWACRVLSHECQFAKNLQMLDYNC